MFSTASCLMESVCFYCKNHWKVFTFLYSELPEPLHNTSLEFGKDLLERCYKQHSYELVTVPLYTATSATAG